MRHPGRTVEQELGLLAAAAHGIVTPAELLRAGITPSEIRSRLSSGALLREYGGVYRVGHRAPSVEARYLAAVRACGDGALLSGRSAAYLFGLLPGGAPGPEVTARTERRIEGSRTRHTREIGLVQATVWRRIPVTTVPRTLVDIAVQLGEEALSRLERRFLERLIEAG